MKLFIIEEHHEAFILWAYCIKKKILSPSGNCLFHVDSHSDMALSFFTTSLKSMKGDLEKIYDFTYQELSLGNFIYPTIYQGIVNHIVWLDREESEREQQNPIGGCLPIIEDSVVRDKRKIEGYVQSRGGNGKQLIVGELIPQVKAIPFPDRKNFIYQYETISRCNDFPDPTILDIDLDYFSCESDPLQNLEVKVEITKEAYVSLQSPYHPMTLLIQKTLLKKEGDKFYAVFNKVKKNTDNLPQEEDRENILNRIDRFIHFLEEKNVQPKVINVCRSRYSGFTPSAHWEFIEKKLTERLAGLYGCEVVLFDKKSSKNAIML